MLLEQHRGWRKGEKQEMRQGPGSGTLRRRCGYSCWRMLRPRQLTGWQKGARTGGWKSAPRCGRRVCSGLNLGSGAPPGRLGALFLQRWIEAELEGVDRWSVAWDVKEGFLAVPAADEERG